MLKERLKPPRLLRHSSRLMFLSDSPCSFWCLWSGSLAAGSSGPVAWPSDAGVLFSATGPRFGAAAFGWPLALGAALIPPGLTASVLGPAVLAPAVLAP